MIYKNTKVICFDLDGVLINSIQNMSSAWKNTCLENDIKIPFLRYKKYIGLPFYEILKKLGIKKNYKKIFFDYNKFSKKKINLIKLYPDIKSTLKNLRKNFILGLITSKNKSRTIYILKKFKLKFDLVLTPEDLNKGKPYPDAVIKIKKKFKVKPSEIIYIGDTLNDIKFSKNSKINFLFANWGYGSIVYKKINKIKKIKDIYKFL
tara:strand:+ start:2122 stop:2739 length:618 start_codon:yes stop_codon:yes gene_type:complete